MIPAHRCWPFVGAVAALVVGCAAAKGQGVRSTDEPALAIAGSVILADGTVVADAIVLVTGDRISAVGPAAAMTFPAGTPMIGGPGKWIVPGLIDSHIHFFESGGLYTRPDILDLTAKKPYAEDRATSEAALPLTLARYLRSGVTSVVDVGGPMWNFEVREVARRTELSPRVAVAGPLLSSAARPQLALDDPPILPFTDADQARAFVRELAAAEADLVKLWWLVPAGATPKNWEPVAKAAIEEAHARGIRVAVHATELETARAAVLAGADVLVHPVDDVEADDAFLALLRERKVLCISALTVFEGYAEALGSDLRLSELEQAVGDPSVISTLLDPKPAPAPGALDRWRRRLAVARENVRRAHAAGVLLAAGTDAGNIGTLHGPAIHRELEILVEVGLTPAEAIRAATVGSARVFGRDDLGTLEPGKLADLLVLDANPLEEVRNLSRIDVVVKGGVARRPGEILTGTAEEPPTRPSGGRGTRSDRSW